MDTQVPLKETQTSLLPFCKVPVFTNSPKLIVLLLFCLRKVAFEHKVLKLSFTNNGLAKYLQLFVTNLSSKTGRDKMGQMEFHYFRGGLGKWLTFRTFNQVSNFKSGTLNFNWNGFWGLNLWPWLPHLSEKIWPGLFVQHPLYRVPQKLIWGWHCFFPDHFGPT